jgi:myo-inositol catabolism protein IolS
MITRQLGQTDIFVSPIAMGCWTIAGDAAWGRQDEADSIATIHAALDKGINFFDTAEAYGDGYSEQVLGAALAGIRHDVVIATKFNPSYRSTADIQRACEDSLRRLKTDYIDLYQLHWPNRYLPVAAILETLAALLQQGKIRAAGVCNFGVEDLHDLLAVGRCETNQVPYSLLWRAIEFEIKEQCLENNVGILAYSPLVQGLLTGKFSSADEVPEERARTRHFSKSRPQSRHNEPGHEAETFKTIDRIRRICLDIHEPMARAAIAWLLQQSGVASVLVGVRRPEQVIENVAAAELVLPPEVIDALDEATANLKKKLGANPDLWQSESRFR